MGDLRDEKKRPSKTFPYPTKIRKLFRNDNCSGSPLPAVFYNHKEEGSRHAEWPPQGNLTRTIPLVSPYKLVLL